MNKDTISEPDTCRRCGDLVPGAGYECICDNCAADLANSYMDGAPEPLTEEEQERFSKELEDYSEPPMKYQKKQLKIMKNKKTDWNFVAILMGVASISILMLGMAKWNDKQSRRIDRLELEVISLQGSKPARSKVIWHGNTY